jgi:tRNA (cytidine/uridine-2'-O-)-methyltransferase
MFAVVLVHPEIPPNTGNVIRLTANTGADLHLVQPLGFRMDDRDLRRAGLDYHEHARVRLHSDYAACWQALLAAGTRRAFAFTTHAQRGPDDVRFEAGDALVFGSETRGLPDDIVATFAAEARLRIPMLASSRSLNLSNAVAVAVYTAWRQLDYAGALPAGR